MCLKKFQESRNEYMIFYVLRFEKFKIITFAFFSACTPCKGQTCYTCTMRIDTRSRGINVVRFVKT